MPLPRIFLLPYSPSTSNRSAVCRRPSLAVGNKSRTARAWTTLLIFCSAFGLWQCGGGGGNNSGGNNGGGNQASPSLGVAVVAQGNFTSGQQGASYNIKVTNTGNAATSGTVTVTDPPTGFTVTAMSGSGWSCTLSTTTCTRSDSLAQGQSYPPIVVTGNVTAANGTPVSIPLSASGGGASSPASASPNVIVAAPALSITETNAANFNLGQQGAIYNVTVNNATAAGATNSKVTVTETTPAGETLASMSGNGWTCPGTGGANSCDRSDSLASGASYPPVSVMVNVAANATSPQLSTVAVSGGGMASPVSNSDSTTINAPDVAVTTSHNGTFTAGGTGTFNISVSNVASGATAGPTGGPITVSDTLGPKFGFISAVAAGWNCGAAGQTVTCTNPGPINPGASAATIPLVVQIGQSAEGTLTNTATVTAFADTNLANDSGTDSVSFSPDLAISETHSGTFGAGIDGVFTLSVNNVGNASTTAPITVTDTLPAQFTFVSGNASGWGCGAAAQVVTCTSPGLNPGTSAASIPLIVAVSGSASGTIPNTATVSTPGDTNSANDSATDTFNVLGTGSFPASVSVNVPGSGNGGAIFAGGNSETVAITVANDGAGDVLTPALSMNGVACATCGTLGNITAGTPGNYTMTYTPPASVAAPTTMTLTVSSSLTNSFAATVNFPVFPAGMRVVKTTVVPAGPGVKNVSATVFNDPGNLGATVELLASGYACPPVNGGGTSCGTLAVASTVTGTTVANNGTTGLPFTKVNLTYTPPATAPNSPYDKPMILAVSNGDLTQRAETNFVLGAGMVTNGALIAIGSRLNAALSGVGPVPIFAGTFGDTGVNKTFDFSLTANGANCQPGCGTLGNAVYTRNGTGVNVSIPYTPPATVPAGAAVQPVLTVSTTDVIASNQQTDNIQFQINDGACGSGNESILNGPYAFLVRGGAAPQGYVATLGSFTADGKGGILAGLLDVNRSMGPTTGVSIVPTGSSYSVGTDNRGCLTLANSSGGMTTFRFAVGTFDSSNHATQGRIIRFDDLSGNSQRTEGLLRKQDPTAFTTSAANGNYVFGYQGVQSAGARLANVGLYHADGAGNLTNFNTDAADGNGNVSSNLTTGSGTYSIDPTTGRGTGTITIGGATNIVLYVVNSSEILSMTTDPLAPGTPILSGENRKQTTTNFSQTALDNNSYVVYLTAMDPSSGGNVTSVQQVQFTSNGVNSGSQDLNDTGVLSSQPTSGQLTISANGRATDQGTVVYLIGTGSAVILLTDNSVPFGYAEQQVGGPFSNASLMGPAFFGGGAATTGTGFDSGSINFDGVAALTVNIDDQGPNSPGTGSFNFSYAVAPATGKLTITPQSNGVNGALGYVISSSKAVFMSTGTQPNDPELFVGQLDDPVRITSTPPSGASEGVQYAYGLQTIDTTGGTVTYTLTSGPQGASLAGSSLIWTPTHSQSRNFNSITIVATSSNGPTATQTFSIAPAGTVEITQVDTDITPTSQTQVPNDLTSAGYTILFPTGLGSFTTLNGTGTANGTFSFPNVPAGSYYLRLGSSSNRFIWTSANDVDLGSSLAGRPTSVNPTTNTPANFSISSMSPWQSGDALELWTPNNDDSSEAFDGIASVVPSPASAATTFSPTIDWENIGPLLDNSAGDQLYVFHLGGTLIGSFNWNFAEEVAGPIAGITQSNGAPANITAPFAPLPLSNTLHANIQASAFSTAAIGAAPTAILHATFAGLHVAPPGPYTGEVGEYPALAGYDNQNGPISADINSDIVYGDPFPQAWTRYFDYRSLALVPFTAPGATSGSNIQTLSELITATLPVTATPVQPTQGSPTGITVNGLPLVSQQQNGVGATPTFVWQSPVPVSNFRVRVFQLTNQNGNTVTTLVFNATTTGTALQIPPGVLTLGNSYVVQVRSLTQPVDWSTAPNRFALPLAISDEVSSIFVP